MILVNRKGLPCSSPTEEDVHFALADVIANPTDAEEGFTSVSMQSEDGWLLTAYACALVTLEHLKSQQYAPSHLKNLSKAAVLSMF